MLSTMLKKLPSFRRMEWLAHLAAVLGLFLGILAFARDSRIASESASMAATASARMAAAETRAVEAQSLALTAEARAQVSLQPRVVAYHFVAGSPDLLAETDLDRLSRAGLSARLVNTPYQERLSRNTADSDLRYLFIVLENQGPGMARRVNVQELQWTPDEGQSAPQGVADIPDLGALQPGQLYMLLVDAAAGMVTSDPLSASHAQAICVKFEYTDVFNQPYEGGSFCSVERARLPEIMEVLPQADAQILEAFPLEIPTPAP